MAWWVLWMLAGCGGGDRCERQARCEGGDDASVAVCQQQLADAVTAAEERGCGDEQRDVQDCLASNGTCDDSGSQPVYRVDTTSCATEQDAFGACVSG